jgi:hypothetical protein
MTVTRYCVFVSSILFWFPTCILYKKQAHFSQLFCLQVRSVTPWQSHDRKSWCLSRGRRHSSILYSPSGFFSSYFINEVMKYIVKNDSDQILCFRIIHFILISTVHALFLTCLPVSIWCLSRGRRHSSILYSPSGFFSSYFINEVNF